MANKDKYDIFISYRRRHSLEVESIYTELIKDYNVFFDQGSIKTGSEYEAMIFDAIKNAQCFLVILTKESCIEFQQKVQDDEEDWVEEELHFAHENNIPILPIVLYSEKDHNEIEKMIVSLEKCIKNKKISFLSKLQLFKVRLDFRTRLNDIDTLKKELDDLAIKRKILDGVTEAKTSQQTKFPFVKTIVLPLIFITALILTIVYVIPFVNNANTTNDMPKKNVEMMEDKADIAPQVKPSNGAIHIQDAVLEDGIVLDEGFAESIVALPHYILHTSGHKGVDFRSVMYHKQTILPIELYEELIKDLEDYKKFLRKIISKNNEQKNGMNALSDYELEMLFFEKVKDVDMFKEYSNKEKLRRLTSYFEKDNETIRRTLTKVKNITLKKRKIIKMQVLNGGSVDKLIKNTSQVVSGSLKTSAYRMRPPKDYGDFFAVPVSTLQGSTKESFEPKNSSVVKGGAISELWFVLEKDIKLCANESSYTVFLSSGKGERFEQQIQCNNL